MNNGTHAVVKDKEEIEEKTLIFYGAGSHYQNRKVENYIKIICYLVRIMLIHTMCQ